MHVGCCVALLTRFIESEKEYYNKHQAHRVFYFGSCNLLNYVTHL